MCKFPSKEAGIHEAAQDKSGEMSCGFFVLPIYKLKLLDKSWEYLLEISGA